MSRGPDLVEARRFPSETLRLLDEKEADLAAVGADPTWAGSTPREHE